MRVTLLPFLSLLHDRAAPVGTRTRRARLAGRPAVGQLRRRLQRRAHGRAAVLERRSSCSASCPIAVVIATMAGFAIGHLRIPGARILLPPVPARPDAAVRGHHHAALLPGARPRAAEHQVGDHPAAHRAVHAVRRVLDAGPLRQHAAASSPRPRGWTARAPGSCSGASTCRWPGPPISSLAILLFLWTWNQFLLAIVLVDDPTKRTMAGALGAFQGHGAPTSRCCAPGRC